MSSQHNSTDNFWQSVIRKPTGLGGGERVPHAPSPTLVTPAPSPEPEQADSAPAAEAETGDDDSYRAIRIDPKHDRQFLLELRYRDPVGNQAVTELIPYALIGRVQLMGPFLRLRLSDTGESLLIEGRHLERLIVPLKSATLACLEEWNRNYHREVPEYEPKITRISLLTLDAQKAQNEYNDRGRSY